MKNEKLLYQLMNDLFRYLLKYGNVRAFSEEQAAEALTEAANALKMNILKP